MGYDEVKDQILKIAAKLFKEKGYKATSLRDIAEFMEMQKASLYYYIESKEQLLVEIAKHGLPKVIKPVKEIVLQNMSPKEKLKKMVYYHICVFDKQGRDFATVALLERRWLPEKELKDYLAQRKKYEKLFQNVIDEGIESGEFPPVNSKITTFAMLGMINSIYHWYDSEGPLSLEDIAAIYTDLIVDRMLQNHP